MTSNLLKDAVLGRFENIPSEVYHKELPYFSNTDLTAGSLSMANIIGRRNGPEQESDALEFGKAFHGRMEHFNNEEEYLKLVAVPPSVDRRSDANKKIHADFEAASKGKVILDPKDWDKLENMLLAVKANPESNGLLLAEGMAEETFVWKDADTGVICKCRPDKRIIKAPLGLPDHMIIDWKTSKDCDLKELSWDIKNRRYHVQAAFYLDGISAVLGHDVGPFINVFVEKGNQWRVVCCALEDDDIKEGRELYKAQLAQIAEAQKTNIWPGFVTIRLPGKV